MWPVITVCWLPLVLEGPAVRALERARSAWLWRCIMSAPTPNSEGRGSVYSPCGSANRTELRASIAGDTDGREQANANVVTLVT